MKSRGHRFFPSFVLIGALPFVLAGCGPKDIPAPIRAEPQTLGKIQKDIDAVKANPALSDRAKQQVVVMISGQKQATETAEVQKIMNSPNLTPEQKNAEIEILKNH